MSARTLATDAPSPWWLRSASRESSPQPGSGEDRAGSRGRAGAQRGDQTGSGSLSDQERQARLAALEEARKAEAKRQEQQAKAEEAARQKAAEEAKAKSRG